MATVTKLSAAPVPYPNGGAIKAMAAKNNINKSEVHDKMRAELKAKHEREAAELEFKIKTDSQKLAQKGKPSASKASTKT
jgi:hypothetical protein